MKPFYAALLAALVLTPAAVLAVQSRPAAAAQQTSPIAFISVQKILTESSAAKAAAQQLDTLRKTKQDEVNAKKKALDDTKLALANSGGVFSGSRRAELQKTEQQQEAALKQATEDAQKAFLELQHQLQTEIRNDLGKVINEVARERPVQYILNADTSLVWARNATDLTPEVLERLNEQKK
jgi:Skp family chaperone for outer membrane proteins